MRLIGAPLGCWSQTYRILGASAAAVELEFNYFSEQGVIRVDGEEYAVCSEGWLSGSWKLEGKGKTWVQARKPSALFRQFEVVTDELLFELNVQSALSGNFDLVLAGEMVGTIERVHPFTRRTIIDCSDRIPELARFFAFWLVVMLRRRNRGGS